MAGNSSDAEEPTQEAFLQVFRKIGSFRGGVEVLVHMASSGSP